MLGCRKKKKTIGRVRSYEVAMEQLYCNVQLVLINVMYIIKYKINTVVNYTYQMNHCYVTTVFTQ